MLTECACGCWLAGQRYNDFTLNTLPLAAAAQSNIMKVVP
jgi:hypothetical protein